MHLYHMYIQSAHNTNMQRLKCCLLLSDVIDVPCVSLCACVSQLLAADDRAGGCLWKRVVLVFNTVYSTWSQSWLLKLWGEKWWEQILFSAAARQYVGSDNNNIITRIKKKKTETNCLQNNNHFILKIRCFQSCLDIPGLWLAETQRRRSCFMKA